MNRQRGDTATELAAWALWHLLWYVRDARLGEPPEGEEGRAKARAMFPAEMLTRAVATNETCLAATLSVLTGEPADT